MGAGLLACMCAHMMRPVGLAARVLAADRRPLPPSHLSAGAYGRTSQARSVLSIALVRR